MTIFKTLLPHVVLTQKTDFQDLEMKIYENL